MIDREAFLESVRRLEVYDSHEHLRAECRAVQAPADFFDLLIPYVCDDLVSAGMARGEILRMLDRSIPFSDRWSALAPHLDFVQSGSYFGAVRRSLPALGAQVNERTARLASEQMRRASREGYYRREFERLGIVGCDVLMDSYCLEEGYDPALFRRIPTVSRFCPADPQDVGRLSTEFGADAGALPGLEQCLDRLFSRYEEAGVRAVKLGSAYARRLDFGPPDRAAAQSALDRVAREGFSAGADARQIDPKPLRFEALAALDDFLVDGMVARAGVRGMRVHIHTGIHAWNYNDPGRCHAAPLRALIDRHPEAAFVLLHCGYPFEDEALLLAKYYPNVKLSLAWVHIVDRVRAVTLIERIAQMIPASKVLGFGGDYMNIENIAGHLEIARENLADAFLALIASGDVDEARALRTIARWLVARG